MTMLRLTQLGKSRTVIAASLLSQVGDYSLETLKNLPDGDVIGDVAQLLQLPLEKTSIHDIERHLYHQQVRALNHAIFSGGNEDRLMQYFGKLQFFLYDVKLLLSGMALNMSNEMIQSRLIDYDLL
jgi:4-hydroxy-L-threonine phosphate dehydrogenase PdxA